MTDFDWHTFIEEYYDPIYRFCHQFLRSSHDAEDATQQAFLKAYKSLAHVRDRSATKAWIYSIARNVCIDRTRWWKRTLRVHEQLTPQTSTTLETTISRTLRDLIFHLPQKQREVFLLRHWHGFSTQEAADLLGIQPGTVKSHLKRAVDTLRQQLTELETKSTEYQPETSTQVKNEGI